MANVENVKRAIAVMENVPVEKFDIRFWLGECETVACFVGWLAVSPDIPEITFVYRTPSSPSEHFPNGLAFGEQALAEFLDIDYHLASELAGLESLEYDAGYSRFYNKNLRKVLPADVIEKLKGLI